MSQHDMGARAPIDESVQIPEAVKRAAARSNEIHAQAYNTPPATPPAEGTPPVTQPGNPPPVMPAPLQAPAATAPTEGADGQEGSEPQRSAQVDPQSWEARYWAMKGRFDQGSNQMREMRERVVHLENLLAEMEPRAPAPNPATIQGQPMSELKFITDKDRDEYGPEMIDLIERAARGYAEGQINAQKAEIEQLKQQLGNVGATLEQDANQKILNELDKQLPQWRGLNTAPEFLQWAELPDVYSGVKRIELMRQAFGQHNAPRVLAFFKGYLAEQSAATAPATTNGSQPPPAVPTVRLEELAAPGRIRPTTPPTEPDRPVITGAQIKQFYEDVRRGRYTGREAEQKAIEAQIFQAQREGRLQSSG